MQVLLHQLEVAGLHGTFELGLEVLLGVAIQIIYLVCELWDTFSALGEILVSWFHFLDVHVEISAKNKFYEGLIGTKLLTYTFPQNNLAIYA